MLGASLERIECLPERDLPLGSVGVQIWVEGRHMQEVYSSIIGDGGRNVMFHGHEMTFRTNIPVPKNRRRIKKTTKPISVRIYVRDVISGQGIAHGEFFLEQTLLAADNEEQLRVQLSNGVRLKMSVRLQEIEIR